MIKDIKVAPRKGACRAMWGLFMNDKDRINFYVKPNDYRLIPDQALDPVDYEEILPGYVLAVDDLNRLHVDCPLPNGSPEIITPAMGSDERTLFECFLYVLWSWWIDNDEEHHPNVHPSWYKTIETMDKYAYYGEDALVR